MNNNYLILGLVLFFGILYYCFSSSLTVTENFQSSGSDADAINTLAQLARQLISSTGATVPGNLTIGGHLNVNGTIAGAVMMRGTASPDVTKIQFGDGTGWRIRYQVTDTNPVMDIMDTGSLFTKGQITSNNGNIIARDIDTSGKYKTRLGGIWSHGGVYGENGSLELGSKNNKVYIGAENNSANTDLIVTGNLNILGNTLFYPTPFRLRNPCARSTYPTDENSKYMGTNGSLEMIGKNSKDDDTLWCWVQPRDNQTSPPLNSLEWLTDNRTVRLLYNVKHKKYFARGSTCGDNERPRLMDYDKNNKSRYLWFLEEDKSFSGGRNYATGRIRAGDALTCWDNLLLANSVGNPAAIWGNRDHGGDRDDIWGWWISYD